MAVPTINIMQNAKLNLYNVSIDRISNDENAHETIETHGILTVDSTKVISNNNDAIYVYGDKDTELNIKGNSEINTNAYPSIYNRSNGKITIEGGIITSKSSDTINNQIDGIINITGGKISSETGRAINNYGTIEI